MVAQDEVEGELQVAVNLIQEFQKIRDFAGVSTQQDCIRVLGPQRPIERHALRPGDETTMQIREPRDPDGAYLNLKVMSTLPGCPE